METKTAMKTDSEDTVSDGAFEYKCVSWYPAAIARFTLWPMFDREKERIQTMLLNANEVVWGQGLQA